jgi:hypothetical protein
MNPPNDLRPVETINPKTVQQLAELGIWNSEKFSQMYYDYTHAGPNQRASMERHVQTLHDIATWTKEKELTDV